MTKQRLSVDEAAERLGVSVATIRRRMKKGELDVESESDAPNAKKWILIEEESAQEEVASQEPSSALTVRLEDEVQYLRSIIETRDRELAEMRMLLARAQEAQDEKLAAIEATVSTVVEQTTPVEEVGEIEEIQQSEGFWSRFKRIMAGS